MTLQATFVDLGRDIFDRHAIYALTSILKAKGIDVSYVSDDSQSTIIQELERIKPSIVMYSSFSTAFKDYAAFDEKLKKRMNVTSIVGGPSVTYNPQLLFESSIDAACMGEGDIALPEYILSGYQQCPNVYLNNNKVTNTFHDFADLDSMPFPDRSIIYDKDSIRRNNPSKTFISGRGCPFMCTYCFNHIHNKLFRKCGSIIRKKSVDYILEEVAGVLAKYPLKTVVFNDDTFIVDQKWFLEFAERFSSKFEISYSCNIRANLMTDEIARALAESRCAVVNWSIESGDENLRNTVLKRHMSDNHILYAAEVINKYKLKHRIGNVIGLPGESEEQINKTIEMNIKCSPNIALANIFVPFPGLELTKMAIDGKYYTPLQDDQLPSNYFTKSVLNLSDSTNTMLQKSIFLFPTFVAFPILYFNKSLNRGLYSLPKFLLRLFYELFYAYKLKSLYRMNGGLFFTFGAVMRYIKELFRS